ncbi:hypothetical protein QYE76_044914 [Lolium multiflorum]|uniref:Uncharacterized protein n=1 Tax=Lolium multiflorum TaxID=4521 RepID=A0AAD8TK80_LOLMU|nr:hypothetical protein QYE76_044914 [Lolium multiflorum]
MSSCESEYIAVATAACQGVWLGRLLGDLLGTDPLVADLHVDNKSAIQLCKNPVFHDRSKHIEVHYHFIRNCIEDGTVTVQFVGTEDQLADVLTKALGDALPHGGFNPNNLYSPAYEQREPGPGADGDPFTGRRGPLEFDGAGAEEEGGSEDEEDDEEEEVEDEDDDEDEEGGEEEDEEGAGDNDLVEVDADGVKKKKKKASGTRGPKWTVLEDLCLCESWATMSHDSIIGTNQKYGKYWARIKAEFDERKLINNDYNKVTMKRSQKAMSTRWAIIQASVNSFHGYHHDLVMRADSGADVSQMFDRAMEVYRRNSDGHKSFALMHCYSKLKVNEKWRLTCLSLSKGKDTIDLDAPLVTSAWRPTGNKAAKAALADAASCEKTQASITKCLADVSSTFLSRDKKADERWAELLKRQEEKLELKKRRDDMLLRVDRGWDAGGAQQKPDLDDIGSGTDAGRGGPGSGSGSNRRARAG